MEQVKINFEYSIGDFVYHATPDSDKGVITNMRYEFRDNQVIYEVSFGRAAGDSVWCYAEEISVDKTF